MDSNNSVRTLLPPPELNSTPWKAVKWETLPWTLLPVSLLTILSTEGLVGWMSGGYPESWLQHSYWGNPKM